MSVPLLLERLLALSGRDDLPLSPLIGVSSGSSGQRRKQLPPRLARVPLASKSVISSSEPSDSKTHYLEALKTSLGDISQGGGIPWRALWMKTQWELPLELL